VAQAKKMTGIFGGGLKAGFLSGPMGLITTAVVIGGVLYFATGGGKKRRSH